jgi:hypothetical protein
MTSSSSVIDELLAFDDRPELFEFRFSTDGLLAFPFFRWGLYSRATEKAFGLQTAHAERDTLSVAERANFLLRSAWANPLRVDRTFDLVVFGTSAGAVVQREGRWFDRNNDYFAAEYPDRTLVVDAAYRGRYKSPRYPEHVRCGDGFALWAAARSRLGRPDPQDAAMLARLVAFLKARFPVALDDGAYEELRTGLLGFAGQLPFLRSLYRRFFERVQPKLIFVEDGSYGGNSHVLRWAKEAAIVTAELQHGLIAPAHLAYNYGDALRARPELASYLPDHVLLYGDYWIDQLRTPSNKVVIGWPHFSQRRAEFRSRAKAGEGTFVIVSQGTATAQLVATAETLSARFAERRVVFRLHPGEVPFRERYARLAALPNVRVSDEGDIYDCFADANAVIGHSSTAVVEAAALGIPTFVLDDASSRLLIPPGLATRFADANALADALSAPTISERGIDRFWARDWQANFRAFVERVTR